MLSHSIFLPRPELTDTILQAIRQYSLTAIVAPTGYGKTTMARLIAESVKEKAWYYAVPAGPHDASFLWHDMFSQFEAQGMGAAHSMLRLGFPESASQWRQALELLRALPASTCLILDDCHLITDPALLGFWERAVRAEIHSLRLVLFSRTRPDISLEELRLKGYAAVFEQNVLAFSEAETREYFHMHGIREDAAASDAHNYSEGWPAALWLCLQSWLASGRIIESHTIDSLLATVFAAYSPEERDLLMRLSVLENFTDQDAHSIATIPHSAAGLRTLREKNPFLSFDAHTGRYQFHAIFRDFLRKELDHSTHIDSAALYRLAGECCVARNDLVAAVRLFKLAGRDEDLARLLDVFLLPEYDETMAFFHEEIFAVVASISWPVRMQNPLGYLGFVTVCILSWNDPRSAFLLEEMAEFFSDTSNIPEYMRKKIHGEIEILRGVLAFNDLWAVSVHYEKAHALLGGPSFVVSKGTAWNLGSPSLAFLYLRDKGRYSDIVELIGQNWQLYRTLSGGLGKAGDKMFRAEYLAERGEFAAAEMLAHEVLEACGEDKHFAPALAASFCLARLAPFTGNNEKGGSFLETLRPQVERIGLTDHLEGFDLAVGYVNAAVARLEAVPEWLRNGEVYDPPHSAVPPVLGLSLIIHCRTLLQQGEYTRVAAVAEDIPTCTLPLQCLFAEIHSTVLKAIAAWHTQGRGAALKFLSTALELSRPDGIILPLAEYGGHIVPMLRQLRRATPDDTHSESALGLAEHFAHVAGTPSRIHGKDLLTPREKELMRHVVKGETNLTIAEHLGISGNTVKNTLSRAYAKLKAESRTEAAQRFVERYGKADKST